MKREVTLTVFFNIITVLFAFFFLSYLTKHLTIEDFGKYQLIMTYLAFVGLLSFTNFNMIINRSVLRGRDYLVRVLFLNSYKYSIVLFFIFIFIFVVSIFQHFIQNEKLELLYIALLFLPLLGLEKYEAVLNAKQKFAKIRLLSLISLSSYIGLSLIFMHLTDQYLYIFLSLFITKLFTVCVGLLYANKLLIKEEVDYDPKGDLKEGYKLSLLSFYNVGIGHLDKLIVGLIDYKLLAIYAIGILIPMKIKDQLKLVVNIMIQSWAKNGDEVYKTQLKKFHNLTFFLTLILAVFLAYSSSFYIPVLFTEEYLNSQDIIWIIWDGIISEAKTRNNDLLMKIINSLLDLFCIRYTNSCKTRRKYVIYFAISLLTETINYNIKLINNETYITNIIKKINLIYKEIKKNEILKKIDYLFSNVKKSNLEKTIEKIEKMNELENVSTTKYSDD